MEMQFEIMKHVISMLKQQFKKVKDEYADFEYGIEFEPFYVDERRNLK